MPRELSTPLPQPIFNEGQVTPDPKAFKTKHPSDNQQYKQIESLLTKDVVSFVQSRVQPSDLYTLQSALGPHGAEGIQAIKQAGQIVFHCAGDTGASSQGKFGDELPVHHPPFCYEPAPNAGGTGGDHSSSLDMLQQIDTICKAQGVYPHAILSGHAHNYQRFTRTIRLGGSDIEVPFIICGDGGHNVLTLVQAKKGQAPQEPQFGVQVDYLEPAQPAVQAKSLVLEHFDDTNFGYLRITVDKSNLQIDFHQVGQGSIAQSRADTVTVELASRTIVG